MATCTQQREERHKRIRAVAGEHQEDVGDGDFKQNRQGIHPPRFVSENFAAPINCVRRNASMIDIDSNRMPDEDAEPRREDRDINNRKHGVPAIKRKEMLCKIPDSTGDLDHGGLTLGTMCAAMPVSSCITACENALWAEMNLIIGEPEVV